MGTFGKSAHIRVPKNGTSGAEIKILKPLLLAQHSLKMMELSLVLSVHHYSMGFKPISKLATFLVVFEPFSH